MKVHITLHFSTLLKNVYRSEEGTIFSIILMAFPVSLVIVHSYAKELNIYIFLHMIFSKSGMGKVSVDTYNGIVR